MGFENKWKFNRKPLMTESDYLATSKVTLLDASDKSVQRVTIAISEERFSFPCDSSSSPMAIYTSE